MVLDGAAWTNALSVARSSAMLPRHDQPVQSQCVNFPHWEPWCSRGGGAVHLWIVTRSGATSCRSFRIAVLIQKVHGEQGADDTRY